MVEREKGTLLFTGATASIRGGAGFSEIGELRTSGYPSRLEMFVNLGLTLFYMVLLVRSASMLERTYFADGGCVHSLWKICTQSTSTVFG